MTLDEFYKRLLVQKNSQSSNLINNTVDTSEMSNTIKNIQNNKVSDTKNNIINSYGSNTKKVLKAPISKTLNKSANIDISNFSKQDSNIFEDIGNNVKNLGIGIKQGGLNFTNYMAKVGDFVSDKVFNREEKTIESLNEDLKQYGIDGSKLTIQEKINKLIEIDPLSMDKYSDLLSSKMRYTGDGITSKIGNALSVMQGNNSSGILAPYQEMIDGKTITEDENGKNQIDSWFGKNNEKNIDNRIVELQEEANKNTENVSNPILKYTAELAPSIGNNATSMAISAVNPLASTLYFTGSAANSYALDGKELGLSDDASLVYGTILGVIDGQLEKIGLENFKKGTKGMLKGNVREAIKKYAIDMVDNYIQEALMEPAQETVNQLFVGKSNWNGMLGRMNEAGMSGAVSSAILGGTTGTVTKGINTVNNIKVNNQVKTEIINKIDSTNLLENNVKDTLKKAVSRLDGKSLATLSQNLNILDEVKQGIDKTNIDDFLEKRLGNKNNQALQNISTNPQKEVSKQAFLNSAKANNINVNNNTEVLDSMFEMAYQRGVNISIDGKAFTNQNQDALWRVNKETGQREVIVNPNNPTKALQNLTIHEMTHDMENTPAYQQLSKVVLDYAKKQNNYDNAFKELSNMYAEEYKNYNGVEFKNRINQEMVADILGEKLGNQEFVSHIVNTNNNVAKNIYNWVVDKLNRINKLTGYKFEKIYWADVKNKFDKAFNSEFNNIDGETKYHISSNLSENIDIVLNNINERNPVRLRDYTPSILVKNGIKDLPMYENASHIRKNIFTEAEAIQKGLSVGKRDHYHGLGKEIYIKAIDSLDNPRVIFKNNKNNEYLILTVVKDNKGNNIVVPIEIETTTNLNKVKLDINRVKTVYGYEKINNIGLNDYIKHNIKNSKMTKIYEQKKEQGTGFSTVANSFLNNIIPQTQQNINNETLTDENIKKYILPEIEERYKNESKEKITETLEELKSQKSKIDIETDEGWDKNFEINQKIKALENGYDNIYEFLVNHDLNELRTEEIIDKIEKKKALEEKQIKLQREIEEATPFKRAQYELIQKTNPMFDEEHVGIRSPKDIKTFEECIRDADEDSVFVWGDYTKEDAKRDLKRNKVRVYSSYAIKNGVFVSTSYRQALDYAGNDPTKVHSKEVNPSRIAWINGDEGQYASVSIAPTSSFFETKTDNKGRQLSTQQQEYFKDSKVRDENGNLIEVYHASKNKFTKFDKSKIRTGITLYSNNGDGFYFTDSKGMIDDYIQNGEVYSVYLNITKPFTVENNLSDEAKNVLVDFSKQTYYNHQEEESKKRFGRYEIFDADDIGQISGSAILSRVVSAYGDEFTQFLKDKGYDGIKASVTDYHNTGSKYDYIAFEPNQIKNVDNVNPTASDDIRYSKSSNSKYQKFLQDNFSNDGTKTYMEDIKLPSKIANLKDELRSIVDKSKDMDSEMKDSLIELINNTDDEKELQSYKESLQPKAPVKSGTIKITNYKNAKLNSKVVNNALSMIEANKQGRRTKTQWLQVAEQIGMNIKENEIDKYAYKTWSEFLPNQKDNLNRQGEKYVKFTRDEWIKAVEEGYKKANEIKINYLRNTNSNGSKYSYGDFGQNLEPAGEYMNQDTTNGEYKVPGFEYGTITFKNPLILDHKNTSSTGWKKDLSNMFNGKTGKKLSNEIIKAGYDAIITKDENGNYVEIVNLNGKKINGNGEKNFDTNIDNKKSNIIDEKVSEYIKSVKYNFNTNINIDTNVVNKDNIVPIDYENEKQTTIYKRARDIFQKIGKRVFINKNDGKKIYVTNTDINESISKTIKNPEQKKLLKENMAVFSKLDKIIENGKEISNSKIDNKGRENFSDYRYYVTNAIINSKKYVVEFDTRVQERNNGVEERHFRLERIYEIKEGDSATGADIKSTSQVGTESPSINNIIPSEQNYVNNTKKTMNPTEIANLKPEDASSTPDLQSKNYEKGDKESSFYKNITNNSKFLNPELRKELKNEDDIKYYKSVTNEESLTEALKRLDTDGASETSRWFNKKDKFTSSDVAEGYILLKRYQDVGDYKNATEVAKKMRDIGTTAGQTIQAFNILNRLTPEGMTVYSQKILSDTFEEFKKNKTQEWIKENEEKFNLTAEEQDFIKEKVNEASKYDEHSYERRVALAEIQKMMEDKLPTTLGKEVKSWMRIAMLCNPKTQVRNVTGNAIIVPVNAVSDFFASGIDKYLSKFTGVRTTGNANVKSLIKGAIKGAYEATNDYKKGINTKNIDGNRFEIGKGKSFTEKTIVGKSLNNIENLLNYVMDAGDRVFSEAWFENSIANQLELNNTTEITQDMIDIATQEALSRTWNDNNNYTKLVLNIRKALNGINVGGYGLGDVLIPFAKTPANLTKAIVDYSPVGLVNSLVQGVNLKNSISTGQVTAQQQHKFVQDLGKATAGTLLYIAGYALAKVGITTGDSDEDKDAKNFIQKTLGINSYSIKIGDKSFTYDWAQPIAAPLSITANIVNSKNKEKALYEAVVSNLDTAGSILLEQSFLSSINDVLSNNDGFVSGLINEILELPARAIPTFSKQIADLVDGTQRQTFVKGSPIKSAGNQMLAKIPFASRMLAPTVDTLGNEVKKYGGKNNIFNVMFNPANVNSENISEAGKEIYKIYQKTGDKTIFPRTADYSLTYDGENYNLSTQERAEYQKIMGKYVDNTVSELIKSQDYQSLDNKEKAKIINEIVSDGNEIAKLEYAKQHNLKYERTSTDLKVENEIEKGLNVANAYVYKANIRNIEGNKDLNGKTINGTTTNNKINYIMDMEISDTQKQHLVNLLTDNVDYNLSVNDLKKLNGNYLTYLQQSGKTPENGGMTAREQYIQLINSGIPVTQLNKFYSEISDIEGQKDSNGDTISGSKKQAVFNYVNSLSLSVPQKQILLARQYESFAKLYYNDILNYINNLDLKESEKYKIYESVFKKLN